MQSVVSTYKQISNTILGYDSNKMTFLTKSKLLTFEKLQPRTQLNWTGWETKQQTKQNKLIQKLKTLVSIKVQVEHECGRVGILVSKEVPRDSSK